MAKANKSSISILLVDDNAGRTKRVALALRRQLEIQNIVADIDIAYDIASGKKMLGKKVFQVVVCDAVLPEGQETLAAAKTLTRLSENEAFNPYFLSRHGDEEHSTNAPARIAGVPAEIPYELGKIPNHDGTIATGCRRTGQFIYGIRKSAYEIKPENARAKILLLTANKDNIRDITNAARGAEIDGNTGYEWVNGIKDFILKHQEILTLCNASSAAKSK